MLARRPLLNDQCSALALLNAYALLCCGRNNWCAKTCPLITGWRRVTQIQKYANVNKCTSIEIQMHKHRCAKTKPEQQKDDMPKPTYSVDPWSVDTQSCRQACSSQIVPVKLNQNTETTMLSTELESENSI